MARKSMTITLGGRISITLALVWAALWLGEILDSLEIVRVPEVCELALYFLAFPLGWLSGLFSGGHGPPGSKLYWYLLLTIPNSLLLGYCLAGIFHALRKGLRLLRRKG